MTSTAFATAVGADGVTPSTSQFRAMVAEALALDEAQVELERVPVKDSRSAKCFGRANGQEFFAKIFLADPYPVNVVAPWLEAFDSPTVWRSANEQLELEWKRTHELRSLLKSESIAEPMAKSSRTPMLVWKKISGDPVLDLILSRGSGRAEASAAMLEAGRWLRDLHRSSAIGEELLDAEKILGSILRLIEGEKNTTYLDQASKLVKASLAEHQSRKISASTALGHGDFTLANLIWDRREKQLRVVDLENSVTAGVWQDLATMVCSLRKQLLNPLVSRASIASMEASFWSGYGDVSPALRGFVYTLAISRILFYYPRRLATRGERRGWAAGVTGTLYRSLLEGSMMNRASLDALCTGMKDSQ